MPFITCIITASVPGKMAQCKSTYTKPGNLSSIPDIYMVEEENWLLKVVLWAPQMSCAMCTFTHNKDCFHFLTWKFAITKLPVYPDSNNHWCPLKVKSMPCLRYSYQLRPKALEWHQIVLRIVDFQGDETRWLGEAEKASERPDLSWTLIVRHLDGVEKSGDGLGACYRDAPPLWETGWWWTWKILEEARLVILSSRRWNVTKITWHKNVLKSRGVAGKRVLPWPGCRKQRTGAEPAC